MKRRWPLPIDLRGLILFFVLISVFATLCNSLVVSYRVQRDALVHSALEANAAYAAKVASSIGEFLRSAQRRLKYSAAVLPRHWNDPDALRAEALRLQAQDDDFNSIAIVNANGVVLYAFPDSLQIDGKMLRSEGVQQALAQREPTVSSAYLSVAGNLVVFVSSPITSPDGEYLGAIGGSVYLRKQSALHTVISSHFHHEGTFAFVADSNRRLLYHPNQARIGEVLGWSKTVDVALRGESGKMEVPNYRNIPMLAGYAPVQGAHWAVVAQQPRERALVALKPLMIEMILGLIPAGLVGIAPILAGTALIAHPLHQLSKAADQLAAEETELRLLGVQAWYKDASNIRQAMLTGVRLLQQKLGKLSHEAQSDPLTGLANRRAMASVLKMLEETNLVYAVLALDIDHFKRVNDSFGHDAGDVALKHVADILKSNSRTGDLACRAGGEEFTLVMPEVSLDTARGLGERIREIVENSDIPKVGRLTISIGVACRSGSSETAEDVLKRADERLYKAKESGRNKVMA